MIYHSDSKSKSYQRESSRLVSLQANGKMLDAVVVEAVRDCSRCGGNHRTMIFRELNRSEKDSAGIRCNHFAICPKTKQPILMRDK